MDLVDDQQVEGAGRATVVDAGDHLVEQGLGPGVLQPVDAHDQPGERCEGVGPDATVAPELAHRLGVHDAELEAEPVAHLLLPLHAQAGGANQKHGARPVAQQQLLDDKAGLYGLVQAHVAGDQQVGPRHGQRPDHRVELVVLDGDPTSIEASGSWDGS